ncbi:MAG: aminopeptidase N C-terminal domain-containing protein, partial [Legionellales bacterium]|nr:aminopeptidase N C-terminal domain-containing protein [Legionellales bacterium]
NSLLGYIVSKQTEKEAKFLVDELNSTNNITEQLSIMFHLNKISSPYLKEKLDYFYDKWKNQPLTYEKWLRLFASSYDDDIYQKILEVKSKDPIFSHTNPNHIRSLFGFFSMENLLYFHAKNGKGYSLVLNEIVEIDKFNPQLSSRLVAVFSNWKKFIENNKNLMHKGLLNVLSTEKISKNLFEMVEKIIN